MRDSTEIKQGMLMWEDYGEAFLLIGDRMGPAYLLVSEEDGSLDFYDGYQFSWISDVPDLSDASEQLPDAIYISPTNPCDEPFLTIPPELCAAIGWFYGWVDHKPELLTKEFEEKLALRLQEERSIQSMNDVNSSVE